MKQLARQDSDSDNQSTRTTQSTRVKLAEALAMIERMRLPEKGSPPGHIPIAQDPKVTAPPGQILISPDPKVRAPAPEEHPVTAAARAGPQI
jgi:hypothetical protein